MRKEWLEPRVYAKKEAGVDSNADYSYKAKLATSLM